MRSYRTSHFPWHAFVSVQMEKTGFSLFIFISGLTCVCKWYIFNISIGPSLKKTIIFNESTQLKYYFIFCTYYSQQ